MALKVIMSRILGRASPKFLVLAAALVCSAYFLLSGLSFKTAPFIASHDGPKPAQTTNDCSDLPGANSTLVVMKTGSTEIHEKLPIHLETTFRCYPNHMIFSDVNEQFQGEKIIDALEDIDTDIKDFHSDFKLYRRLREHGREALDPSELSDALNTPNSDSGKSQNEGWKLDKWKFLPMLRRVLDERPDMEWYIFVETDTFIFWKTLLAYLAALDSTKPYYMGAQINIGEVTFAQGGSAYAMSKPAVELVVNYYIEHKREWENFTDGHWAGDCVLSKFLQDAGGQLTHAWPIYQGDSIGNMNYDSVNNNYRLWCHPTVSYHHMTPAVIKDMWEFEQQTFFSGRTVRTLEGSKVIGKLTYS